MKAERIVCFGDSITQGQGLAETDRWTAALAFLLDSHAPARFAVYNRGVGGNTTSLALDRIQADVAPLLPATVLVEFGINDGYVYPWCRIPRQDLASFRSNLLEIIRQIGSGGGKPVLIVNHPVASGPTHLQGNGRTLRENLQGYDAIIREAAGAAHASLIDLPRLFLKERQEPTSYCADDGVHLSPVGNGLYAKVVFRELRQILSL